MKARRLVLVALLASAGCSKKAGPPQRTEPWLANPSASTNSASGAPHNFRFLSDSRIHFSVPGRKGKVSGHLPLTTGSLALDPLDLKRATASIDVDLTQLSIDADALPEGAPVGDSSPSALGLQWLELGANVTAERRSELSKARFELSSVEGLSAAALDLGATRGHVRVRATVVGTLRLHGFRAPLRTDVLIEPQKVATGAPLRLSIHSAGALLVPQAAHDTMARGPSGFADPLATGRAAYWFGKSARVECELIAEAGPPIA